MLCTSYSQHCFIGPKSKSKKLSILSLTVILLSLTFFFIWCALQILYCGIFPQEVKYYPPWIILYPKNVVELSGTLPPLTHYGLTGRPIKNAKVPKKVRNGAQKSGMITRNLEHQFFSSVIENYIRYSALQCHLAAAFCFIINVAWFIFSDLSSDARTSSCLYFKRYIIYGQNSQSQVFQQNNLLKSRIGSLVKSENCNRTASPPDLAYCAPPPSVKRALRYTF